MTVTTKRDFVDGVPIGRHEHDGSIGLDPRALRGGNIPSVFSIAHWMRDRRLSFTNSAMTILSSPHDDAGGTRTIVDDEDAYDLVIVGSGIAGLASAFWVSRARPDARILLLDCKPGFGGNSGRDDQPPLATPAPTGGAYAVAPYADFLRELYREIGLDWERYVIADPVYSYFFDEHTPFATPGVRRWALDVYGSGLRSMPYPDDVLRDIERARQTFVEWYDVPGGPMDPHDWSDPAHAPLSRMSLHHYLTETLGLHEAVSDYYTRFSIDALAGTTRDVNAFTATSFLSAEHRTMFSPPGGNSTIARYLLRWLIPSCGGDDLCEGPLRTSSLDDPASRVRLRQGAMAMRADADDRGGSVVYLHEGIPRRVRGRAVILAGQGYTARMLVDHLVDDRTRAAWSSFDFVPVVTANVALRSARPLHELGLGYDMYWWGSKYWADFVVADWTSERRRDPDRPTVLTFFGGNLLPPSEMAAERVKLLRTPFESYEQSIREDLERVLGDADFVYDRDVTAVYVYRWGHGMVFPKVGFPFGFGELDASPRHIARQPLGAISFAGQDTEGSPGLESAVASGLRAAQEVLPVLDRRT